MSLGAPRTLDAFGWSVGLGPTNQRIALQAACDSGERILLPIGDTVTIDSVVILNNHTQLTGGGCDFTNTGIAASQIVCVSGSTDILRVNAYNVELSGFNVKANQPGCTGIAVGDGITLGRSTNGVLLDRISTDWNLNVGVDFRAAANCAIRNSPLYGLTSALQIDSNINNDPASADSGDNWITNCKLQGSGTSGAGLRALSGGGIYVTGCKFLGGLNHIYMDWNFGGSGNFTLEGCSLESNTGISFDMRGEHDFKRMEVTGNTWGGIPSVCIAVRNFSSSNWLKDLLIEGNTFDGYGQSELLDLGCTDNAFITSNTFRGNGTAPGIITRNGTGAIGPNRFVDCPTTIVNSASWPEAAQL